MISKPAVTGIPLRVTTTGSVALGGREIVSIHYVNTTAGVGRVDISEVGGAANEGITLSSDAANGNDHWVSSQPVKFDTIVVTFTTGTGVVTLQVN